MPENQHIDVALPEGLKVTLQLDEPISVHVNFASHNAVIEAKRIIPGSTAELKVGVALSPNALRTLIACLQGVQQKLGLPDATIEQPQSWH